MKKHLTYTLLLAVIIAAVATRLYKLGEIPKGLYVDEAGQGYSAYSILKTGMDEFGKKYPIVFRSLTDFKTPVYIYLIVPLIPVFGLTAFAVRFPSFLFSILTIPVLFLLIRHLTKKDSLALLTSFLLAVSPWHILFGRTNFECNVALFFMVSGILFFFKGLKNPKFLLLSSVFFSIAIPAYHSQRIITPLIVAILGLKYKNILFSKSHIKYSIIGVLMAIIISLPTLSVARTPGFLARATGLNIFSHTRQMPDGYIAAYNGVLDPVINGSWFLTAREFFSLYFSYLSPRYMFVLGDYGPRSSFPELSTFFLWMFPFYIFGIYRLFSKSVNPELRFLIITLLLISPIPAAVTRDPYTTIRALPLVVPQVFIISLGILSFYGLLKNNYIRMSAILVFVGLITYSFLKIYSSVFLLNEYYRAKAWEYGWEEVAEEIVKLDKGIPVIIDNARADAYPQIAFYLKYDPSSFQNENFEVTPQEYYTNMYHNPEKHVGRVITRAINWERDLIQDQYLIGDELGISTGQIKEHNLITVKEIDYPDGTPAYRIVRTNPEWENMQRLKFIK